ncbi:hypothetical protein [Streptomyces sp. NPDC097619]|uniref:hypothetical protein n=1 Tax=Streptomyces sp. NPDC097619 TaxID=3157228 RepID=UPI00332BCAC8
MPSSPHTGNEPTTSEILRAALHRLEPGWFVVAGATLRFADHGLHVDRIDAKAGVLVAQCHLPDGTRLDIQAVPTEPTADAYGTALAGLITGKILPLYHARNTVLPEATGPDACRAEVLRHGASAVNAPWYTVTVLRCWWKSGTPWRRNDYGIVHRSRARSILAAWAGQPGTHLLRDGHGRFYVARSSVCLELEPTDIAPPATEGEALRAALAVHGFPAYDDGDRGFTWLVVPVDPGASEDEAHGGLHFRISSGEHADRPAHAHDEPWGASLYDHAEYVTTLDAAPAGATLAEDCAHIAGAIASYSAAARAEQ